MVRKKPGGSRWQACLRDCPRLAAYMSGPGSQVPIDLLQNLDKALHRPRHRGGIKAESGQGPVKQWVTYGEIDNIFRCQTGYSYGLRDKGEAVGGGDQF